MASCYTIGLTSISKECKNSLGGIKDIWIGDRSALLNDCQLSVDPSNETLKITGQTTELKHWEFRPETASVTSTVNIDNAAGTLYVSTELALQFSKNERLKRLQIKAATIGDFVVIYRDNNDNLFYLGYDNPVTATSATAASGTAFGDFNGFNITLSDFSKDLPMELNMTKTELSDIGIEL